MTNAEYTAYDVEDIVRELDLSPHPEGGYYRRTFCNGESPDDRGQASAIYYLLDKEGFSLWHRFDADELWFWHAGAPLVLEFGDERAAEETAVLGPDLLAGQHPQIRIPKGKWQHAKTLGAWTLVSCMVSPGFLFETFELHHEESDSE